MRNEEQDQLFASLHREFSMNDRPSSLNPSLPDADLLLKEAMKRLIQSTLDRHDASTMDLHRSLGEMLRRGHHGGGLRTSASELKKLATEAGLGEEFEAILQALLARDPDEGPWADPTAFSSDRKQVPLAGLPSKFPPTTHKSTRRTTETSDTAFTDDLAREEQAVLRESLFALQGLSGQRLRFAQDDQHGSWRLHIRTEALQSSNIAARSSEEEVDTPQPILSLSSQQWSLLGSGAMDALQITCGQAGSSYRQIASYIQTLQSTRSSVARAFAAALEQELHSYCHFVSYHFQQSSDQPPLTLRQLLVRMTPALSRLSMLNDLVQRLNQHLSQHELEQGPVLLSVLYAFSNHGDQRLADLVQSLRKAALQPWWHKLQLWITQGNVVSGPDDSPHFFFVQPAPGGKVLPRDIWRRGFVLDVSKVPDGALDMDLVEPAFGIGKGLNYIRGCLQADQSSPIGDAYAASGWSLPAKLLAGSDRTSSTDGEPNSLEEGAMSDSGLSLRSQIQDSAKLVHSYIVRTLREEFTLLDHLFALKQFLLLGQGDFFSSLMSGLLFEFGDRPSAHGLYRYALSSVMDSALKSSNASTFPQAILERLSVEVLTEGDATMRRTADSESTTGTSKNTVWDVFMLDYTLPDPVFAVVPPEALVLYKHMFSFLFRVRKVELMLNLTWRQSATLQHAIQTSAQHNAIKVQVSEAYAQASVLLRQISMIRQAMMHFVNNLKTYLMFEVLEGGWNRLQREVNAAETLDELIHAHDEYLNGICRKSLLPKSTNRYSISIDEEDGTGEQVQKLLQLSSEFCAYQEHVFGEALQAAERAVEKRRLAEERITSGEWGFQSEAEISEEESFFGLSDPSKLDELDSLSSDFHGRITDLLKSLDDRLHGGRVGSTKYGLSVQTGITMQDDLDSLRFLEFQLNHNGYYDPMNGSDEHEYAV